MQRYKVPNMTCGHCAGVVEKAVRSIDPKAQVTVDLGRQEVAIETGAAEAQIAEAIKSAGYENQKVAA